MSRRAAAPLAAALLALLAFAAGGCLRRPPPPRLHAGGRHVVLLVPGWSSGGAQMRVIAEEIGKAAAVETHRLELTGLGVTETIQEYAQEVDDYVSDLKLKPADRLDFVSFSFGTLVSRWWVEQMGGRAHTIISVCAPHHGTTKGSGLQCIPSLQQMQPGSAELRALHRSPRGNVRYHSIRLDEDRTIRPNCSSILPGGANYVLRGKAHMAGPYRQVVRELIRDIYLGKAVPSGPQKLTPGQLVELKLADPAAPAEPSRRKDGPDS